jgi:hypothetical protein
MNTSPQMMTDLSAHQALCRELLALAEGESKALRHLPHHKETNQGKDKQDTAFRGIYQQKKALLPRLTDSLNKVRRHRVYWRNLSAEERASQPELDFLVKQVQDLIMRVIHLDRENEQGLLRRGLIPAREIPPANQHRPHFVADLYKRQPAS